MFGGMTDLWLTRRTISPTPHGGTLVPGGATFRVWAPCASAIIVSGDFNGWKQDVGSGLGQIDGGHSAGFVSGVKYLFFVGVGTSGY
jgi:1,4-alpha-glucan branching enzyme